MGDLPIDPPLESQEHAVYAPSHNQLLALSAAHARYQHFLTLKKTIKSNTVGILLQIALKPGITVNELIESMGQISQASCSRNINLLSHRDRHGAPGLGLVDVRRNPKNPRQHAMFLTAKGEEFMDELEAITDEVLASGDDSYAMSPHT